MGDATRRALRGLIRAMCPTEPKLPDLEDRLELQIRRMLQYMTPIIATGFVIAVHVVDWAPLWRAQASRRIQHLPAARGADILTSMGRGRFALFRTMILGIRGIVLSSFYDQDEVHAA